MIIYLELLLPIVSSDLPESRSGKSIAFFSVLLRMGFTCAPPVTRRAVVSYTAFPPLPDYHQAVYFCCTGLGVTSTGCYPASCPVKPGLSSPVKYSRDHLSHLYLSYYRITLVLTNINHILTYTIVFYLASKKLYFKTTSSRKLPYNGIFW